MVYPEFGNIDIQNCLGVAPVGAASKLITRAAEKIPFKKALDLGTGTGFTTIYFHRLGRECDGVDKSKTAVACAQENAKRNSVAPRFFAADLFRGVRDHYDLIIFNPPFGEVKSKFLTRCLEFIKSFVVKNRLTSKIGFKLLRRSRGRLIQKFLDEGRERLTPNGQILVILHDSELHQCGLFIPEVVDEIPDREGMKVVLLRQQ